MADPILIVGAGPTGLTAALELSRLGVPVRLIDKLEAPATTSRAIGIQARTLELMAQRGLADEMLRLGHPAPFTSLYGAGKRLGRIDFAHVPSRYRYVLFLSQAETERILREAVERQGVTIERGVTLAGLAQDALSHAPAPVNALLRHADGRVETAATPWLISAEGAHSTVRTTTGLQFEGKTLDDSFALGDIDVDGELPDSDLHIFYSGNGLMAMFPMGGARFRLIASDPPGEGSGQAPSLALLQSVYDQRSHIPARLHELRWSSWFHINSRMVAQLRVGRLLLGGDSAHIHSPAGAQGMNTGIQDMINLAWKLALVVQGRAPARLLDSYGAERLPVMRQVLFETESVTDVIASRSPFLQQVLDLVVPVVTDLQLVQRRGTAQISQVSLSYRGRGLSADHPHAGSLRAGDRVPDLAVRAEAAETGLHALLDPSRFTLLVAHGTAPARDPAVLHEAAAWGNLAKTVELTPPGVGRADYLAALGGRGGVFLVRPDGYVGMAAGAHGAARALDAYRARWFST